MTSGSRHAVALFLALVAGNGLVVAPLVHAEQHYREEHEDEAEAAQIAETWTAESGDPLDALAFALKHVHDGQRARPARDDHRTEHHGHSHGPGGGGPHGSNSLAHLSVAMHSTPELPAIAVALPEHVSPAAVTDQLSRTLSYLVPQWSQGPPIDC